MNPVLPRLVLAAALAGAISACTPTVDLRGNEPSQQTLEQIVPGRVTRSDVLALLGTPSSTSIFGEERWFYIGGKTESFAFFKPEEVDRQVVVIDFDRSGKVKEVKKLGLKDGRNVDIATEETPTTGKDLTVLEQLLGNVGRFNPGKKAGGGVPGGGT